MKPQLSCIGVAVLAAMWILTAACNRQYIPSFHYKNPAADQSASAKLEGEALPIPEELQAACVRINGKIQRLEDESAIENLQRI